MNALWTYFWPVFGAGLVVGVHRRTDRVPSPARPMSATQALRARVPCRGVHAASLRARCGTGRSAPPIASRAQVERGRRKMLVYYEMTQVTAHTAPRSAHSATCMLSGPADDFQRSELVRLIDRFPGVSERQLVGRRRRRAADRRRRCGVALLGFLFGLLLAYLVELRRRHNAQWNW